MNGPSRAYVDANVILRFLTGDPPDIAAQSKALIRHFDRFPGVAWLTPAGGGQS